MIRSFFKRLWRLITAPFRLIARPFIAIRNFITYEPEDAPLEDVFARAIENPSVLVEHIEALRGHLFRSLLVLIVTVGVSTIFAERILNWLSLPVGGTEALQAIEVTESIGAFMRVSLLSGFTIAVPYIGFEMFAFINPGLRRRERVMLLIAIPIASLLFIAGLYFAYKFMLPIALPFLLDFMNIATVPRPSNYIRFVTGVMFWTGISFQFPLVIYTLAALGIVQAKALINGWRFAVLG
ncbi:MAG TPA: twin-arginine translocase subunit TatC, partial [Anaerolineae bacterium]|nr:twin-arginine translocase subunit TatC [Anaerolineae bacterium]